MALFTLKEVWEKIKKAKTEEVKSWIPASLSVCYLFIPPLSVQLLMFSISDCPLDKISLRWGH